MVVMNGRKDESRDVSLMAREHPVLASVLKEKMAIIIIVIVLSCSRRAEGDITLTGAYERRTMK